MDFTNSVLTISGQGLIAQASSANRIVFVAILSSETYMDESTLRFVETSDFTGPSGNIKTAACTNNVARIIGEFTNQATSKTVKTVAITARLSTQSDDDAVVVLAQSDPDASIYIPSTSEISTSVQVAFNLSIGDASLVEVTSAASVSLGDFERLKERTVTTHADGDAGVGDAPQIILGEKRFKGIVRCDDTLEINETMECFDHIRFQNEDVAHGVVFIASETPDMRIEADATNGGTVYIRTANFDVSNEQIIHGGLEVGGGLGVSGEVVLSNNIEINGTMLLDGDARMNSNVIVGGELKIYGASNIQDEDVAVFSQIIRTQDNDNILECTLTWPNLSADRVVFSVGGDISCDSIDLNGKLDASGNGRFNGSLVVGSTLEVNDDTSVDGNMTVTGSIDVTLDTTLRADLEVFGAVSIPGLAPYKDNGVLKVPNGGIVYAFGDGNLNDILDPSHPTIDIGDVISIPASKVYIARWNGGTGAYEASQFYVPSGRYAAMMCWGYYGGTIKGAVLLQRVG